MENDAVDSRIESLLERTPHTLQTLSCVGRNASACARLDGGEIRKPPGNLALERSVPARLVPLRAPIEQRARDADRIDAE